MTAARLPVVGVLGSGREPHADRAAPLGHALAERGAHLLTGGGGGAMAAVSAAFAAVELRRGLVLGVLPGDARGRAPAGYPNPSVELVIRTHLPLSGARGTDTLSRNHLNVLSSDVLVALPGGEGTASEVRLALAYGRPLVCFLRSRAELPGLPDGVDVRADLAGVLAAVDAALGGHTKSGSSCRIKTGRSGGVRGG